MDNNTPVFIKSKIKLSIGILVSNHIKYIRKAMEAIEPLLKAVPSELIAVDTVGNENSDGSLEVVKEYTDKIYHFDWIDDFSAARNVAMEHAEGEWFMYFDDDEYFDDVSEFIDFFKTGESNNYNYAFYYTADYYAPGKYQKNIARRMIRRTAETAFVGIIHEHFNIAYNPTKEFRAFTHHFGYLYENEEQKNKKKKRNINLLEKDLSVNGINLWSCAHLINELRGIDPEKACSRSLEYVETLKSRGELRGPLAQWLILLPFRYIALHSDIEVVKKMALTLKEKYDLSEMAWLVISHIGAAVAYGQKKYGEASAYAKEYFERYDYFMSHEDKKIDQMGFDLGLFMNKESVFISAAAGLVGEAAMGNAEAAYGFAKRLDFDDTEQFVLEHDYDEIRRAFVYALENIADSEPVIRFYKTFYNEELFEKSDLFKFLPKAVRKRLISVENG